MENLDFDRLAGSPEMLALFLGILTHYAVPKESIALMVGLPIATMTGEDAGQTQAAVRQFLSGEQHWYANGRAHKMTVESVRI